MADHDNISVATEEVEDGFIFRPKGEIDLSRAPALRTHLADVLKKRPARLIVDLTEVPYMDSAGLATLVEALQVARRHDTRLVLCGLQDRVRSIFEITRLVDTVFTIVDDTSAAMSV